MNDLPTPHPVDTFLDAEPGGRADVALRHAILARTAGVLRRRRWQRRAGLVAALAACYLAGVLTMRLTTSRDLPAPEVAAQPLTQPAVVETAASVDDESALDLEWRAFESSARRAELYQLAGDRYLEREGDLQSALRCYRQALDAGPDDVLTISASDNWLLIALKEARQKEKAHAPNDS